MSTPVIQQQQHCNGVTSMRATRAIRRVSSANLELGMVGGGVGEAALDSQRLQDGRRQGSPLPGVCPGAHLIQEHQGAGGGGGQDA